MNGTLVKVDRNGTQYFEGEVTCDRCDGKGVYIMGICNGNPVLSPVYDGLCFKCGGAGVVPGKWKVYTPEYEAKLAERRAKAQAKRDAEHEAQIAARLAEIKAEEAARKAAQEAEEKRIAEEKAKSQFEGAEGERLALEVTFERLAWYERQSFSGFGTETVYIYKFRHGDNLLVWKTTKGKDIEAGSRVKLAGTVKAHEEYKGEKQTVLTRCKITA